MLQMHTVMDNVPRRKIERKTNGSLINQFSSTSENNNSQSAMQSFIRSNYCCENIEPPHETSQCDGNLSSSESPGTQLFIVNRYDEENEKISEFDTAVSDAGSAVANERRDSGFHTMSRPSHENDKIPSQNAIDKPTLDKSSHDNLEINFQAHKRSSPLLVRKSDHRPIRPSASQFANKLFLLDGFTKEEVAQHISKTDDYSIQVASKYMEFFDFGKKTLDEALRSFFTHFVLTGESQERERILEYLANRYIACNPEFLDGSSDTVHKLICAIALLNTDLHLSTTLGNRRRMTCKEFINNTQRLGNFPAPMLKDVYRAIKKKSLPWSGHSSTQTNNQHQATNRVTKSPSVKPKTSKTAMVARSQSNRLNRAAIEPILPMRVSREDMGSMMMGGRNSKTKTLPKKQGVLFRKVVVDSDGNRTSKRKRKWKLLVIAIQGLELHLAKKGETQANKLSIHHTLAEAEPATSGATKRQYVFRVLFANTSAALFQASSEDEMRQWINVINRNAALLSAAPLPAAIGSQLKFQRPLQPSAPSTLPMAKQLHQQESRLSDLRTELDEIPEKIKQSDLSALQKQYYVDKQDFLQSEVRKYDVYTSMLEEMLQSARKFRGDFLRTTQTIDLDQVKEEKANQSSGSLISVSPSEPGAASASANSVMTSSEQSDSTGNLLDFMPRKHSSATPLRTVLSPTSSLPNLHPGDSPLFKFPPVATDAEGQGPRTKSLPNKAFDYVAEVTETTDGLGAVKLIKTDSESSSSPLNANNSNSILDPSYWSALSENHFGYSTTGRIKHKPSPDPTGMTPSTSVERIDVRRNPSMTSSAYRRPIEMVTSLVAAPVGVKKGMYKVSLPNNQKKSRNDGKESPVGLISSVPPRVRGRRERQGSSRYSYLQAVYDPARYDS